jgi:hypothetical protein
MRRTPSQNWQQHKKRGPEDSGPLYSLSLPFGQRLDTARDTPPGLKPSGLRRAKAPLSRLALPPLLCYNTRATRNVRAAQVIQDDYN